MVPPPACRQSLSIGKNGLQANQDGRNQLSK
jgi:hypothetical protein